MNMIHCTRKTFNEWFLKTFIIYSNVFEYSKSINLPFFKKKSMVERKNRVNNILKSIGFKKLRYNWQNSTSILLVQLSILYIMIYYHMMIIDEVITNYYNIDNCMLWSSFFKLMVKGLMTCVNDIKN